MQDPIPERSPGKSGPEFNHEPPGGGNENGIKPTPEVTLIQEGPRRASHRGRRTYFPTIHQMNGGGHKENHDQTSNKFHMLLTPFK
ncbi:hypothetical protein IKT18_01715 [Candidatus Saccharibacteria bacterium]|nr:hypothetical protein [Candidatus Saccharibacteria bacterium]